MGLIRDPVNLEIMWQRVISITEECWVTIWRTAFSVAVGEAHDYGCSLLDPNGLVIAHPIRTMPDFTITLPNCAKAFLRRYPLKTWQRGDVFITNDPWLGAGHLYDIAILTPVFNREERMVAIMASMANVADIGGTRARHTTRELYDEGLFIPTLKLYDHGRLNEELVEIIESNVRLSTMVMGDIHAMVSANQMAAKRIQEFLDEYDLNDLEDLTFEVQNRSEMAMRKAISALPDGEYEAEQWCDGMGDPFCYRLRVKVEQDNMIIEFLDGPHQLPIGGTNVTLSMLLSNAIFMVKCLLFSEIPGNDGNFRPVSVEAPEGSVFNCTRPAAVNNRTRTTWTIQPAIAQALASVLPDKVRGHTGYPVALKTYGYTSTGQAFNDHFFIAGGLGASSQGDGEKTALFPTSAANVSVEMFEMRTGFLVVEKEFIPDSGGPGKFRGALGQRTVIRRRAGETGGKYTIGGWSTGLLSDTPGLFGGEAGNRMRFYSTAAHDAPIVDHFKGLFVDLDELTTITVEVSGGSGFGNPKDRSREAIRKDLEDEFVTPEGAKNQYGWDGNAS